MSESPVYSAGYSQLIRDIFNDSPVQNAAVHYQQANVYEPSTLIHAPEYGDDWYKIPFWVEIGEDVVLRKTLTLLVERGHTPDEIAEQHKTDFQDYIQQLIQNYNAPQIQIPSTRKVDRANFDWRFPVLLHEPKESELYNTAPLSSYLLSQGSRVQIEGVVRVLGVYVDHFFVYQLMLINGEINANVKEFYATEANLLEHTIDVSARVEQNLDPQLVQLELL